MQSLGPEIRQCLADLKADKDGADTLAMKKLPTWEDTLPASVTKPVAEALEENLKKEWQKLTDRMKATQILPKDLEQETTEFIAKLEHGGIL
eukprot:5431490-Amphidinium_carterae.1